MTGAHRGCYDLAKAKAIATEALMRIVAAV
jgi:hypothetical protein